MRLLPVVTFLIAFSAGAMCTSGQEQVSVQGWRGAESPSASPGQSAIDQAAAARKYALVFFWKEENPQTDEAWNSLQAAAARFPESASVVSIRATDSAERSVVVRLGVDRAPMPMVMAIAPCGAITKAFTGTVDEKQLRGAFVSPCTELCLKAIQDRKLVFVCVNSGRSGARATVPQGVAEFRADQRYGQATEIVLLDARDPKETSFLEQLQVDSRTAAPVTVFLAPPGAVIGKFGAQATKQQFIATLASAQADPCAGGKCGPNGCGPKQ